MAFSLGFDPLVDYLDYNADGTPDHVFVITELGSGSVAPRSADRIGIRITFTFDPRSDPAGRTMTAVAATTSAWPLSITTTGRGVQA